MLIIVANKLSWIKETDIFAAGMSRTLAVMMFNEQGVEIAAVPEKRESLEISSRIKESTFGLLVLAGVTLTDWQQ